MSKKVIDHYQGDKSELYDEKGNLNYKGLGVLYAAVNSPMEHQTVDLGIKAFKRWLKENFPLLTKGQVSQQIRKYRTEAWSDYAELVKFKGSFPTVRI